MDMLRITTDDLEEHLAMQPAAIAYYGHLYKKAERDYADLKKVYEIRWKEMYADCARALSANAKKTTINDVESAIYAKYKAEIDALNARLSNQKAVLDNLEVFYDGWKQKGFIMNSYAQLVIAGYIVKDRVDGVNDLHQQLKGK